MDREFEREDLANNKALAAAGYLVFFVPLIWARGSKLGRYCANQGLWIMIAHVLVALLFGGALGAIPLIGWLFRLAGRLVNLALLAISVLCAAQLITNERAIELPFVGGLKLIP